MIKIKDSDKFWYIFGEAYHDCGKRYSCGCPDQLVDVVDEDSDVYQHIPRRVADKLIEEHNKRLGFE
jgi:hypothetical protein